MFYFALLGLHISLLLYDFIFLLQIHLDIALFGIFLFRSVLYSMIVYTEWQVYIHQMEGAIYLLYFTSIIALLPSILQLPNQYFQRVFHLVMWSFYCSTLVITPFYTPSNNVHLNSPELCSICLNRLDYGQVLACDHVFHEKCIQEWKTYNPVCPLCRIDLHV